MIPEPAEIKNGTLDVPPQAMSFFDRRPSRLWYRGNLSLLNGALVGIVAAREIEPELTLRTSVFLEQLNVLKVGFVGGWHSPLEEDCLGILLRQEQRIVICLAKSLNRYQPSQDIEALLNQERALVLSHCTPNAKRISRNASIKRNQLVAGLANALPVLAAPEGSGTFKLAQSVIEQNKPVFALEHPINESILACGALPASLERIQQTLR